MSTEDFCAIETCSVRKIEYLPVNRAEDQIDLVDVRAEAKISSHCATGMLVHVQKIAHRMTSVLPAWRYYCTIKVSFHLGLSHRTRFCRRKSYVAIRDDLIRPVVPGSVLLAKRLLLPPAVAFPIQSETDFILSTPPREQPRVLRSCQSQKDTGGRFQTLVTCMVGSGVVTSLLPGMNMKRCFADVSWTTGQGGGIVKDVARA